ncbi:chemotaxis-specific protein-glutamate methyltransferase CheB [Legionella longbeachae]|uniref:Protein-glutamate methylesterase/protein-glutamine glutaminase n=1 Tax=Legionella longbeachae serogroup 1 (strain NSW150) TaxID=661367 RepID=D3HMR7_LEGLN|nr:chemotaxis-specific protein-glutamate methyltransferase CheB [Legionella longbeachae]VEE04268.1 fused chemotaxis regulator; protein-glutamat [Legionella oakridgensis]HBD7397038.1 chemotaxis-specific protein-glutamate methyltransferase CheB [Legionella pneumophila]ARB92904.1 chemotaxis-specific protein-glutamate methyltransferase CheB [Legionella longbeachae]ARM33955.1 chemotaxis-specific protein-glutamate methyltransferase CheB [Legionella longbeachae]EEZ96839.1 chemotaxis response regulato
MIKILIVDDSPTETALIQHIIESAKDMEVIGVAKNGKEAIELNKKLKPNLITMDIHMPVMDGLEATRIIMAHHPTPIVIISSLINSESAQASFHILDAGALTALEKPQNVFSPSFEDSKNHIIDTLRSLADIRVVKKPLKRHLTHGSFLAHAKHTSEPLYEIIAMGASIGGPIALKTILSQLPADFPVPIVIVQHMSSGFICGFAQWLAENIALTVKNAENYETLKAGVVYIAPEHKHLEIDKAHKNLICKLVDAPPVSGFCPSITHLFQSIARVSRERAIGVLLTGMSDDGATGLLELKQAHGHTLIQDQESSVVFGMGAVAQSLNAVDKVIELENIAGYLTKICTITSE